ncbi:hypothetical protein [Paenirhodobacter sp.]|uniref:hypothetical protein n=1 Tax=Paenirhodobacter sp. TaxID=1965326 RepID=UPI003B50800C
MSITDKYRDAHEKTDDVVMIIEGVAAAAIDVMLQRQMLGPDIPGASSLFALLETIEEKAGRARELLQEQWEAAYHVVGSDR